MRLDISKEKGYSSMEDDLEGNVKNSEGSDSEMRYGCDSKYIFIYKHYL